jgi:uncharacterized protein DUF2442
MSILDVKLEPLAKGVNFHTDHMSVELRDGRVISVPLKWFPRLEDAKYAERENWRLIGDGIGIHWEDVDEDISVEGLLSGETNSHSSEGRQSLYKERDDRTIVSVIEGKDNHRQAVEHHESAAKHYQDAAYHHREAAKHYTAGDYEKAAYHAHMAHAHHLHAADHAAEAAKHVLGMMRPPQ